jgi:hypothetical protein
LNLPRIQLLWSIRAMGHCGEFCYALWATKPNLVVHYGPLQQICLYNMGHFSRFGYALWATLRNEAVQLKSVTISALWAMAPDLV